MAPKAKAKTRAEQMAENIDRLVRERDEAQAEAVAARRAALDLARQLDARDRSEARAERLRETCDPERLRETCDRLRFALDAIRERDDLRAAKGGAS